MKIEQVTITLAELAVWVQAHTGEGHAIGQDKIAFVAIPNGVKKTYVCPCGASATINLIEVVEETRARDSYAEGFRDGSHDGATRY